MTDIWVAYIGVAGSIVVAIFSLLTSGRAKELALRAEATANRHEQIRLKGLEAAEKFLSTVADIHTALASIRQQSIRTGGVVPKDSVAEKDFYRSIGKIDHLRIQFAMYWTDDIQSKIGKLYDEVLFKGAVKGDLDQIQKKIDELTYAIVDLCKESYL